MPTLDRDGVAIRYEVHGTGPRVPVLCTHGFGASGAMWHPNLDALSAHRTAITWDMRGHGASDAPADGALYTHDACLSDMAALLDVVGAEQAILCGMSLGGYLSLRFRLRFPARVRALLLVDTGPGFRDPGARERWNDWARRRGADLDTLGLSVLSSREAVTASHVHGAAGIAHAARGMLVQGDASVFDSLEDIDIPALIVVGAEDEQFLTAAEVMERRIRGARRVVLPGAGHAANLDAPTEFNAAVSDFLVQL